MKVVSQKRIQTVIRITVIAETWLADQLPLWIDAQSQFLWIGMHIMNDLSFLN